MLIEVHLPSEGEYPVSSKIFTCYFLYNLTASKYILTSSHDDLLQDARFSHYITTINKH